MENTDMENVIKFPRLNIWMLIRLCQELDEISHKLRQLSTQFEEGSLDRNAFESALQQVGFCGFRLKIALADCYKSSRGG